MYVDDLDENGVINQLGVLYVEDDEEALSSLAYVLERKVENLFTASNGEEGIKVFKEHYNKIDVVITDIRMPFMNGITMVSHLKDINPNIRVIYISAHDESEVLIQAINSGADGFVIKPISVKTRLMSKLFQISKEINKDKIIEKYNRTLKLVLDCIEDIIVITDGYTIKEVNESFLDFFNKMSLEHFKKEYNCICDLFLNEEGYIKSDYGKDKTWIDIAFEVETPKVKIKDNHNKTREFSLHINPLYADDKSTLFVVEFNDITEFICK
jgi:YesN/AraC family two-component response regulator